MSDWQFTAACVAMVACTSAAVGEVTREQAARLGVDVVQTRDGELRGSILSRAENGTLTIAVRREWLGGEHPERLNAEQQRESTQRREACEQLVARIREWLRDLDEDQELTALLRRELDQYAQRVQDPDRAPDAEPSEFLLVKVDANDLRRVYSQPAERKQAALAAWQHRLPDVETISFLELQQELDARDDDWRNRRIDLADRLPAGMPQSEREWAARRAVYEFAFRDRIEFQGTGDTVFRTDGDAEQAGIGQVLGGLLNGGLDGDLRQLLGGNGLAGRDNRPGWRETAIRSAERDGAAGFRVTRVETDLENSRVVVQTDFLARVTDDSWETIWQYRETLDSGDERAELEDRIRQDPRIAESFKLLESLGLEEGVSQAVQFGAATMEAQQTADDRFFEFFDRYTQRLDGPPLRWDAR